MRGILNINLGVAIMVFPLAAPALAQQGKPLRVLIVSGGGFHDYPQQRQILEKGLESRLNVQIAHLFNDPPPERKTRPANPAFTDPRYGDGYDLIVHNICAADEGDPAVLDAVLAPHRRGVPAVNLHCAMHSFRSGEWRAEVAPDAPNARWFSFTGIQSTGHGPQSPITVHYADHPIARGLAPWTTGREELYNNLTGFGVSPVAFGNQPASSEAQGRGPVALAWTHSYGPAKARVFSLTLAHNEATMADPRYLDLVARGVAWATGHLADDGSFDAAVRR